MRILSISGQNIASLAQPFTVDFSSEPLAGAGLFAITGETGAGKSSILDAMCLALYGDALRQLALAEAGEAEAIADHTAAASERAQLARIDRAAPLRAPWQALQASETRLDAANMALARSQMLATEATGKAITAKPQADQAEADLADHEAEFKAFGPIWDQAASLDQQILSAAEEATDAESHATRGGWSGPAVESQAEQPGAEASGAKTNSGARQSDRRGVAQDVHLCSQLGLFDSSNRAPHLS